MLQFCIQIPRSSPQLELPESPPSPHPDIEAAVRSIARVMNAIAIQGSHRGVDIFVPLPDRTPQETILAP